MPSIIRVRLVISGCHQAFLHFLAAWLHRKNEPKKKRVLTVVAAAEIVKQQQLAHFVLYGSKKSCLIYFQICPTRSRLPAFFMVLLAEKRATMQPNWQNSQNDQSLEFRLCSLVFFCIHFSKAFVSRQTVSRYRQKWFFCKKGTRTGN